VTNDASDPIAVVLSARERINRSLMTLGEIGVLSGQTFARMFRRPFGWSALIEQIDTIGARSMSIVVLTAVFSSMVMTLQFSAQLARFGAKE
jgi:phospholipid/cholesterol/gamma-HCH transport system permease protein